MARKKRGQIPGIRQLPSGLWQASVRMPGGKRTTKTDPLQEVVVAWAIALRAEYRRGSRRDPRAGEITLTELHDDHFLPTRSVSKGHHAACEGRWRRHIEPAFGGWRICDIRRSDVAAWAVGLQAKPADPAKPDGPRLSAASVLHCVSYLHTMLDLAVGNEWLLANPARLTEGSTPTKPAAKLDYYSHDEISLLVRGFDLRYALWLELDAYTGLRWEELAGLTRDHVDGRLELLYVQRIMERDGTLREYAKSLKSHRPVPIPPHLVEAVKEWVEGMAPGELLFTAPSGSHLQYHNFLNRVWYPSVRRVRTCTPASCDGWTRTGGDPRAHSVKGKAGRLQPCDRVEHQLRDLGIHGLRHTAASWLVMEGVDLYRVRDLMGHEKFETSQRYAHLKPGAFDRITSVWDTIAHGARTIKADETGSRP